jgi:phosphohistidine swiveling domain-containing protein
VRAGGSAALAATAELRDFRESFDAFLRRFGHLCDSGNDFSSVPWREIPESVLAMATDVPRGPSPQTAVPAPPPRGVLRTLRRATAARYDREAVGAVFTRGHMALRGFVRALGTRWFSAGVLPSADSVFFLSRSELADTAAGRLGPAELQRRITARQDEMERAKGLHLPDAVRGDEIPDPVDEGPPERGLVGVAASRGIHTGPVRVVRGVDEFGKLQPGDVLVIPYSDVGWSPLLERASAIVAESGGLLSHAAIVAREAGIPAVVSVSGACRIPDGVMARVDGNLGHVALTFPAPSQDVIV